MTVLQAVLGFGAIAAVLTVIPGLDTMLVLRSSLVNGRSHGFAAAVGVNLGALTWGAAAALGAAALVAASKIAYSIVTYVGVAYMVYLGASMIWKSCRKVPQRADVLIDAAPAPLWRSFVNGFTTNLLNPKIGIFYIATIPQFIPSGVPNLPMGLLLAGVHVVLGMLWLGLVTMGASMARRWLSTPFAQRIVDRVAGVVLIGFGAEIAWRTARA
ncbi:MULTISPECIES: LysE family translocator [unclassified Pseudoclavibacter]|uniref:LysE family translocator n=1 Tax=unclassified Pseudoclavibacter TaxID=2615177 RepID=UPI001300DBCA|nr:MULTISPECIES: LysE family translocator [unclassified Pseudoclavibacter]KAB1647345.1 LysE family translocator [Pseudoclavibacter sp. CFCC 14310]KAB1662662.1 LysE family translocator [Pseudoclavibacter sp. CFCC 13611]